MMTKKKTFKWLTKTRGYRTLQKLSRRRARGREKHHAPCACRPAYSHQPMDFASSATLLFLKKREDKSESTRMVRFAAAARSKLQGLIRCPRVCAWSAMAKSNISRRPEGSSYLSQLLKNLEGQRKSMRMERVAVAASSKSFTHLRCARACV